MWVIPEASAEFVCQMEQVLDVYQRPYDEQYPVVCLDESPKQLISESRAPLKASNGVTLYDSEYLRHGVVQLYMLFEPLAGKRKVEVRDSNNRLEWAKIVADLVENQYATATKITLVQDNLKAHKPAAMYEVFEPARAKAILDKIEFVFTPKHGSWLNMAEIEFSVLKRQAIKNRIPDKETLEKKVNLWQEKRNQKQIKANWQFTTKDARVKLKKLYPTL
jgi:transposase